MSVASMPAGAIVVQYYAGLLLKFQAGYAEFGDRPFFLMGFSPAQIQDRSALAHELAGVSGRDLCNEDSDPLGLLVKRVGYLPGLATDSQHGLFVYAPVVRFAFGHCPFYWPEPSARFSRLAAKAGSALPPQVRTSLDLEPASPVDAWLLFMWSRKSPAEKEEVLTTGNNEWRIIWDQPFLDAADAIQTGGLLLDHGGEGLAQDDEHQATRPKKRRGRPRDPEPERKRDKRWWDAWETGEYKTYADLASAISRPDSKVTERQVASALMRHRQRLKRAGKNPARIDKMC